MAENIYPKVSTSPSRGPSFSGLGGSYGAVSKPAGVEGLVRALQGFGCEVSNAEHYLKLKRRPLRRATEMPEAMLGLTADELLQDVEDYAITVLGNTASEDRRRLQDVQLDEEMAESMRAEAESYLDVLRPKFDAAAAEARAVMAHGIQPNDNAEAVIARGGKAAEQWISFKAGSKSVRVLDAITNIRYALAETTGAGEGKDADHSVGITRPCIPDATELQSRGELPHVKWLRLAPHLDLVPFADLSPDDKLAAEGFDVEALRAQAQRQLRRASQAAMPLAAE
jgi:hypothetical protein